MIRHSLRVNASRAGRGRIMGRLFRTSALRSLPCVPAASARDTSRPAPMVLVGSEGVGLEDVMSTREPTFASPAEERDYLTKVKAELDACETKAEIGRASCRERV